MSLTHSFSVAVAQRVGMREAVFLNHFSYWHIQNKANGKHFHDGRYWTYNSVRGFKDQYPYLSEKEIRSTLESLESRGLVTTGNHNTKGMDRTKWYALTLSSCLLLGVFVNPADLPVKANGIAPQGESICPTGQNDLPTRADAFAPQGEALPLLEDITKTLEEERDIEEIKIVPQPEFQQVVEVVVKEEQQEDPPVAATPHKAGNHLFKSSPFYEKTAFLEAFCGSDYEIYDLGFYYETIKNWADSKGEMKKDWLATAKGFMLRDAKKNEARLRADLQSNANGNNANRSSRKTSTSLAGIAEIVNRSYTD
jgi:hypothetical protein